MVVDGNVVSMRSCGLHQADTIRVWLVAIPRVCKFLAEPTDKSEYKQDPANFIFFDRFFFHEYDCRYSRL